jgi:hypothetical protein
MSIKDTKEYVKKLGEPFQTIYDFAVDFIMDHDDNEDGWEIMTSIEDLFTESAQESKSK